MRDIIDKPLVIAGREYTSRLIIGTGKFGSKELMNRAIISSGSEVATVALRRVSLDKKQTAQNENLLDFIPESIELMPNTSGARDHREAVKIARIARDAGYGNLVKIEVIGDMKYLMPDNYETLRATEILAGEGFRVMPYILPDIYVCKSLESAGAASVMPLASPIGSGQGLSSRQLIEIVLEYSNIPVIVDAGLGKPSHAAEAMEMGCDAVLVNTAIAASDDPVMMAQAFKLAVEAGRLGYLAGSMSCRSSAVASSPLTGFLRDEK